MAASTFVVALLFSLPALSALSPRQKENKGANKVQAPKVAPEKKPAQGRLPALPQLVFETGKVVVGEDLATIDLPQGFKYLQKRGAREVVEKFWGNPPNPTLLGLILPKGESLLGKKSWAIIVSFEEDGYVSDDDAGSMDFDEMLTQIQEGEVEVNKRRKKLGYQTVHLVGWGEKPHYDAKSKKLFWAKELAFEGEEEHILNYNVRCLGRRGVLVLNAVSTMDRLKDVAEGSKAILSKVEFKKGNRYSDYVSGDKLAAYGIGALIAGKLLLKAGLFKLLLKPLIVVGAVVIGLLAKLFGKKKAQPSAE